MGNTDYPVNSPLAVKRWSNELMKEALKETFLLQFAGTDSNSLVQIKTELNKDAGDRVTFGIRHQLSGGGVQGDNTLEGNEEALETYTQNVIIDQLRHAVRSGGKMSEQRVPFSVREEAKDGLKDWWSDRLDLWWINQITGNSGQSDIRYTGMQAVTAPDAQHMVFAGGQDSEASLSASAVDLGVTNPHRFSLTLVDKAVERAKLAKNALRPVKIGNDKFYVAFIHTSQVSALRTNTAAGQWLDIQKAAMALSNATKSPIFDGSLGVHNKVILHESTRIPRLTAADGNARILRAVLCGAQSACLGFGRGYGKNTFSWKEELFDYENQLGVAAGCIGGLIKTRFNGSDFATVTMSSYELSA